MNFLSNKHLIVAMLVTPILAILAWMLVDELVGEKPHKAIAGAAYPLLAQSNCRFSSGACDLENTDLTIRLRVDANKRLLLDSSHALQSATFGLVLGQGDEKVPAAMLSNDQQRKSWFVDLNDNINPDTVARLAVQAQDSFYYAETVMAFSEYQTIFDTDLRKSTE